MIMLWKKVIQLVLFSTVALVADVSLQNPFLWEANKGVEKFYLFGTIHLSDTKLRTLPKLIKESIDKSDIVCTEVSMDADFQIKSAMYMMRNDGKSLKTLLSPKLYTGVESYLQSINTQLSISPFENMKVWALTTMIMMLENQFKNPNIHALDMSVYNYAQKMGKDVGGVETIEEQILAMDTFTLKEQINDLESTLDYLTKHRDFMDKMISTYIEGHSSKMIAFLEETMFGVEDYREVEEKFMQVMLYDRNTKMTKRIAESVKSHPKKTHFFAFGVMHFLGEKSILQKLEAKGYSIRRMI